MRDKEKTLREMKKHKIIAIARGIDSRKILDTAEALYEGGIRFIEVTFNPNDPKPSIDTLKSIELLSTNFRDKIYVGAGTVLNESQVNAAYGAGAKYIISPNTDEKVIAKTNDLGLISIPGALTPTEMNYAFTMGADVVKLFPSGLFGVAYIKALLAPLSHIPVCAVGNITEENIRDFFAAGVTSVGIGGNLVSNKLINLGEFNRLIEIAKRFVSLKEE